jgi:rare lipoprotein A
MDGVTALKPYATWLLAAALAVGALACAPRSAPAVDAPVSDPPPSSAGAPQPDLSGRKRIGVASFYASRFAGREMADGARMDPQGDNAASRTLPLGTTAKVTNIENGRSAVVTIEDRGPYAKGRIVDLSPATARKVGITPHKGVAKVQVAPIAVPLPDGRIKPGAAAQEAKPD